MTDALLSTREVAGRLGVSEYTVRRMARAGKLPKVRVGERLVRYRETDVQALIEHGRTVASSHG